MRGKEAKSWKENSGKDICMIMAIGLILVSYMVGQLQAQKRGNLLSVSIDLPEADSLSENRNPQRVLGLLKIQQLLLEVAQNPKDGPFVEEYIEETGLSLDDVLAMGLLRRQDRRYVPGFSLFTQDDQRRMREICGEFGEDLAEIYAKRAGEFQKIFDPYPLKQIGKPALVYILIGCFSLDWDGLRISRDLGYMPSTPPEEAPFIGWAFDRRAEEFGQKKGLYWGSHNEYLPNGIAFTSFGDHAVLMRNAFPDIAWRMARSLRIGLKGTSEEVHSSLALAGRRALYDGLLSALGSIMMELRKGIQKETELRQVTGIPSDQLSDLLAVLENLEYARKTQGGYEALIPIFSPADQPFVHKLILKSREMLTSWLRQNFDRLKSELSCLSAYKYGQPLEASFYKIWHEIFGSANGILVERGLFFDPYGGSRKHEGYLPVVWHMSVAGDLR